MTSDAKQVSPDPLLPARPTPKYKKGDLVVYMHWSEGDVYAGLQISYCPILSDPAVLSIEPRFGERGPVVASLQYLLLEGEGPPKWVEEGRLLSFDEISELKDSLASLTGSKG